MPKDQVQSIQWYAKAAEPIENKLVAAMLADLQQTGLKGRTFSLHQADPITGNRQEMKIEAFSNK